MLQSLFASATRSKSGQGHQHDHRHGGHHRDKDYVFPGVHRDTDGPDCHRDCADCTIRYPWNFKVNNERQIYGSVKPFGTHVLVATGKTDWIPKVEKEKGSLMEAFKQGGVKGKDGVSFFRSLFILCSFFSLLNDIIFIAVWCSAWGCIIAGNLLTCT